MNTSGPVSLGSCGLPFNCVGLLVGRRYSRVTNVRRLSGVRSAFVHTSTPTIGVGVFGPPGSTDGFVGRCATSGRGSRLARVYRDFCCGIPIR